MTEQRTDIGVPRSNWTLEQEADHQWKLRQQRDAWFAARKLEREQQERQQKQAALERHLHERSQEYLDHTGTPPPTSVMEGWQRQYVDEQARQREAERQARLDEAAAQYPY